MLRVLSEGWREGGGEVTEVSGDVSTRLQCLVFRSTNLLRNVRSTHSSSVVLSITITNTVTCLRKWTISCGLLSGGFGQKILYGWAVHHWPEKKWKIPQPGIFMSLKNGQTSSNVQCHLLPDGHQHIHGLILSQLQFAKWDFPWKHMIPDLMRRLSQDSKERVRSSSAVVTHCDLVLSQNVSILQFFYTHTMHAGFVD